MGCIYPKTSGTRGCLLEEDMDVLERPFSEREVDSNFWDENRDCSRSQWVYCVFLQKLVEAHQE
jgi:hypothetical protein